VEFKAGETETQDIYKLLTGLVVPRPIGWASTLSPEGVHNLAPFSFFIALTPSPPHIALSIGTREGETKDTLTNIRHNGEFVLNTVSAELGLQMSGTAVELAPDISEFEAAGLTPAPSVTVKPMRVAEAPAHLECVSRQIIPVGGPPYGGHLVIAEVLHIHVRDDILLDRNRIDLQALNAVGRLAGDWYCTTTDQYEMVRSLEPLRQRAGSKLSEAT
jgi:flavin reductase (DIM6/NTAB) family NADH-FMN oxidoreductase RutF